MVPSTKLAAVRLQSYMAIGAKLTVSSVGQFGQRRLPNVRYLRRFVCHFTCIYIYTHADYHAARNFGDNASRLHLPVLALRSIHFNMAPAMTDHGAIADTVYQYMEGVDRKDASKIIAVHTENGVLDISALNRPDDPVGETHGRENIASYLLGRMEHLETTHMLSNIRVKFESDEKAELTCYALAQHHRREEALDPEKKGMLACVRYVVKLVKVEGAWLIERLQLSQAWGQGDPSVMIGAH